MKSQKILEIYPDAPLSNALLNFIDNNADFETSLKLSAYPRFIFLEGIICSYPTEDEVIGMFYYDTDTKIFKQDYVVNVGYRHQQYVSYSRRRGRIATSSVVKSLDEFFNAYGKWDGQKGEFYCRKENASRPWMHHYKDLAALPIVIRPYAEKVLSSYPPS